ncbi:hypothetical protein [Lacticaseibacillus paracasei]|uniref:hypothetical protein n=1 Tax=Lacticaseibacillus paracasei TaxID=1597 RepID=UPI00029774B9|nr:hypothetical protein [Lacticaseibacillus paracasei]EKQ22435.1 oligosaccharide repeat unit polymerase [Lacticaseibacillus casei UW4]
MLVQHPLLMLTEKDRKMKMQTVSSEEDNMSFQNTELKPQKDVSIVNASDWVFFVGVAIWSLNEFIKFSEISNYVSEFWPLAFRAVGVGLVVISFFLRDFIHIDAIRFIITSLILAFFMLNNGLLAGDANWIDIGILSLGSIGIHYGKVFSSLASYRIIINGVLIGLALLSKIPNEVEVSQSRLRFYLGYFWASFAAHTLLFITFLLLWSVRGKIKWWLFGALLFVNFWAYNQTQTKAPFLIAIFCLVTWFIAAKLRIQKIKWKTLYFLTILIVPVLTILILYLSYNVSSYPRINALLSNRLSLGRTYLDQYGLTLFGHPVYESTDFIWIGRTYQTLDSSLMRYVVKYGIISSFLFISSWVYISRRIAKIHDFYLDLLLLCLAMEAFGDPWFLFASYNIFIILLGSLALRNDQFNSVIKGI